MQKRTLHCNATGPYSSSNCASLNGFGRPVLMHTGGLRRHQFRVSHELATRASVVAPRVSRCGDSTWQSMRCMPLADMCVVSASMRFSRHWSCAEHRFAEKHAADAQTINAPDQLVAVQTSIECAHPSRAVARRRDHFDRYPGSPVRCAVCSTGSNDVVECAVEGLSSTAIRRSA